MVDLVTVGVLLAEVTIVMKEATITIEMFRTPLTSILDQLNTLKLQLDKMEHYTDLMNRPKDELRPIYDSLTACPDLVQKCNNITSIWQLYDRYQCSKELQDLHNQIAGYCSVNLLTIFAGDVKELAEAAISEMKDQTRDGNDKMPFHQAAAASMCLLPWMIYETAKPAGFNHVKTDGYDVFLSFRGDDTRESFTSTLYYVLCKVHKVKTFMDIVFKKGSKLEDLLKMVEKSRISIVVFSENFAESEWCLKELVKIFEESDQRGQEVVPVFYKVKPSELRHQNSGKTKGHMDKHHSTYGKDSGTVKSWSKAIKELGNLSGYTYWSGKGKQEVELAEEIAQEILTRLHDRKAGEQGSSSELRDNIYKYMLC